MKKVSILIFRIVIAVIGLVMIRWYIAPFVSLRVVNAGNIFGVGVGTLLVLIAVFWEKLIELIKQLWSGNGGKALLCTVCVLAIAFCGAFGGTLAQVIRHAQYTATNEKVVLILGCQIRGSVPSSTLKARCKVAENYLNSHPDAVAIATGGQGADEDLSEGQCIFNLLTEAGISPDRIYIEDRSVNTDENVKNAKEIIEAHGLPLEVAVATSEYHQYRAAMICKKNGLTASAVPSRSSKYAKPTFYTREVFGVWAQWIIR